MLAWIGYVAACTHVRFMHSIHHRTVIGAYVEMRYEQCDVMSTQGLLAFLADDDYSRPFIG